MISHYIVNKNLTWISSSVGTEDLLKPKIICRVIYKQSAFPIYISLCAITLSTFSLSCQSAFLFLNESIS